MLAKRIVLSATSSLPTAHIVVKENHHGVQIAHSVRRGRIPSETLQSEEKKGSSAPRNCCPVLLRRMDVSDLLQQGLSDTLHYRTPSVGHPQATTLPIRHADIKHDSQSCFLFACLFTDRYVTFLERSVEGNFMLTTSKHGALVSVYVSCAIVSSRNGSCTVRVHKGLLEGVYG